MTITGLMMDATRRRGAVIGKAFNGSDGRGLMCRESNDHEAPKAGVSKDTGRYVYMHAANEVYTTN